MASANDLVQRLRDSVTQARAIDRAALLHEAADEIERLRSYEQSDEKRRDSDTSGAPLTDAEREALIVASIELQALTMSETNHSDAVRKLLARLS